MPGVDYRGTAGEEGKGIVTADGFSLGGATLPIVVADVETTFDPPSLATVTGALSSGITVDGASLGDSVKLFPPVDMQGIMFQGFVSAANTVKITLFNTTAGTIELASGTWGIVVERRL